MIDFHQETTPHDIVIVLATLPLTSDEQWHAMSPHHYRPFHYGECGRKWRLAKAGLFLSGNSQFHAHLKPMP